MPSQSAIAAGRLSLSEQLGVVASKQSRVVKHTCFIAVEHSAAAGSGEQRDGEQCDGEPCGCERDEVVVLVFMRTVAKMGFALLCLVRLCSTET